MVVIIAVKEQKAFKRVAMDTNGLYKACHHFHGTVTVATNSTNIQSYTHTTPGVSNTACTP